MGQASDAIQPFVPLVTVTIGAVPVKGMLLHCSCSASVDTVCDEQGWGQSPRRWNP